MFATLIACMDAKLKNSISSVCGMHSCAAAQERTYLESALHLQTGPLQHRDKQTALFEDAT